MVKRELLFNTVCNLVTDFDWGITPLRDNVLLSSKSAYKILQAVKVKSQIHQNRWKLSCLRIDPNTIPDGTKVCQLRWHPRGKKIQGDRH